MFSALMEFSRFEIELFFKTYIAVLFTYVMPCAIFAGTIASAHGDRAIAVRTALPLFLSLIILFVSLYTLGTQVVGHREMGFYKRILVTRINPVAIALSNAILGYVLVFTGLVLLTIEGWVLSGSVPKYNIPEAIVGIFFAGGCLFLLGLIPACFVKRTASMFAVASVSSYVLVLFSGVTPNFGKWTNWLRYIDMASPSFHSLRLIRAGFAGNLLQLTMLSSVLYVTIFMAACLLVIRRYLSWM